MQRLTFVFTCSLEHFYNLNTFFKINELSPDHPLAQQLKLILPDGGFSPAVWGSEIGEWLAMFRPLDLGLVYLNLPEIRRAALDAPDSAKRITAVLAQYAMLTDSDKEQRESDRLKLEAGKGTFRFICILPTTKCPLQCAYCHQRVKNGKASSLTYEQIDRGLQKCAKLCAGDNEYIDILFYGGEPLAAFHLTEYIVKLVKENRLFRQPVRMSFTTSGQGMTEQIADFLTYHKIFVILSLDGGAEINDPIRRLKTGSSYETACRAFKTLKDRGCRVGLSFTIGKHNYRALEEELSRLLKTMSPNDIGLNAFLHPCGGVKNPYQIEASEAFAAFLKGIEIVMSYGIYAEQPMRRLRPFVYRNPLLKDCSAPGERLVLAPGGVLGFCDSFYPEQEHFYSIADFPTREHPDYRLWSGLSSVEMPHCSACPAMTVCGGACRFDAYQASGVLDGVDPLRCQFELSFLNWMLSELLKVCGIEQKALYFAPSVNDREKLLRKMNLEVNNQPFTAGSYGGNSYDE